MIFSCSAGHFQTLSCLHFPFFKKVLSCYYGLFPWSRDSPKKYFWEVRAASFCWLWFHVARLQWQYSFKAAYLLSNHSLGTPSTVLKMGSGNWAGLKAKMGEKLHSFIVPSLLWSYKQLYWQDWRVFTLAIRENQECHKLVLQQTLSVMKPWLCWALLPSSKLFNASF